MSRSSLIHAFGINAVGRVAASIAYTIALLLVARWADAAEFGRLSAVLGMSLFVSALLDLGLTTYVLRHRALEPDSPRLSAAIALTWCTLLGASATTASLAMLLGIDVGPAIMLGLGASLDKFSDAWQAILIADGRNGRATYLLVQRRTLLLIGMITLQLATLDPVLSFAGALCFSGIFNQLFRRSVVGLLSGPTRAAFRSVLSDARSYWVAVVSAQARELDSSLVLAVASPTVAGIYAAGARLTRPALLLAGTMANVVLPHFSRRDQSDARDATLKVGIAGLVLMVVCSALTPAIPSLTTAVLGAQYSRSVEVVIIFAVTIGPIAMNPIFGSILQAHNHHRFVAWNGVAFAILALSLTGAGAIFGEAPGAALGATGSLLLKFCSLWFYAGKVLK